ncbi:hypothetical protein LAZ67_21001661 [Cordylochernes scorpioides]|uniref:Retrovirus-related Pol polyprotein from transposon TNT 1-94 n=1 Tax=Cordylochernes scorpioides TaxID=51811 RepID=A0ABY6LM98_9ARAC|nr:hypothetical protein LAZ67_21001661 [Cordylochernes scorpioides]
MASLPSHDVTLNKLDGYNYSLWSFKIEMLLQKEDLWEVVTENIPDEPKIEWKKKDSKARAIINLSIADSQIVHVKNLLTAKATWDTLKNIYERKTLSGKIYLLRKLYSLKLEEDKDMQQHITTMMELVDKLRTIGETLKDSHITAILLCSLPKSYSNLITMLESRPDDELTLEFTKNKLLDEHTRRVESSKDEITASKALKSLHGASSQRREKEKKFCSFCHKSNHSKEECWHYQKRNNSNKEYKYENFRRGNVPKYTNQSSVTQEQPTNQRTTKGPNPKALNCTQREASVHNWFVDSGATSHMAYDESFFTELNREQTQNVVVANGNKLQVKGIGQGEIKVITPQGKTDTLLLTKVLYIPELTDNLLSVSAATSNGCKVTFNRDWCTIERDNTALANGILDNGMYRLHLDDNPQTRTFKANVAKQNHCKNKNCLMLWHDRLGHRNIESIKKIRNENLARGLSLNNCSHSTDCVQCIQGKLTETPFPKKTEYRATETLQLVHSDICGPLPTNSLSGKRYFITFTDDYSRYTKIYLLKGKDEAYEKIKDYVISAHTEFGKNIQTIRTDNGREYVNRQVEDFLNQSGIKHQLTVPYSPAQNGIAERKNRSLMEMTRCMLFDSGLPQSLWAEAVTTANYLHNRIPSKATDKTPFELWTNRKPSLKHLKRFGCKAFAYIPKIKRNKLDSKVIEGIFLGYDDRSKGYRILHDTDNITISRSVKFIEKENGFHHASTKTTSPQVLSTDLTSSNHIGNAEESQEPGTQPENLEDSETEDYLQPGTSTGTQVVTQRRSTRPTKGIPPIRNDYMLYKTEAQDIQTPTNYSEVLQLPKIEREKWLQAMNEEINSLEKNNVWELTPLPKDKKIIICKWTYKQKLNSKGEIERYKARLVAKGFNQKFGRDYEETFAPIVKHSTIRAFLAASVYKGMQVIHLDVKTAFLHGDLDKELYMELPEGLHTKQTNKVCKLKKAIYGLKQAGRSWNTKIASTLIKNNFKQSIVDPCLFTKNEENHSIYLILYVDDMLLASDSEIIIQNTVKTLEKEFEIKNLGDPTQFIGIEISRNREGELLLSQKSKIQELVERYNLQEAKPTFTPMESGYPGISDEKLLPNNVQYQQLIGSLLYLSVVSRPDIAAPVCILSSRNQNPRNCDWNAAKRIVRYLKTTKELELRISNQKPPTLEAYSDATWASDNTDRKSISGNLFLLGSNPISWMTGKQGCVSLSSTEAELISAAEASQELLWLLDLLKDLELEQKAPIYFHQDNQSCLKICSSEKVSSRTKHIATKIHHLKDLQKKTVIKMVYCPTGDMKADILTKPLPRPTFEKLRYNLVIGDFDTRDKGRGGRPIKFEDAELEALLDEDSIQTQEELAETLGVTQQAISNRLKLGVIYYELHQPNETITGERYQQQLMRLSRALKIKRPLYAKRHDKETWEAFQWDVLPHPPYSPDIAPSDYHMFRSMTHGLAEQHFTSYEKAKNWVDVWMASKYEEFFRHGIRMLPERWEKVSKVGEREVDSSGPHCHVAGAKNSIPVWGRTESGDISDKEKDDPARRCQERLTSERPTSRCSPGGARRTGHRSDLQSGVARLDVYSVELYVSQEDIHGAMNYSDGEVEDKSHLFSIRPFIREAFNIIQQPPDLQGWFFGQGLDDDAILASAKSSIHRFFLSLEMRGERDLLSGGGLFVVRPLPPPPNSQTESKALRRLMKQRSIVISRSDKGTDTVILDRSSYHAKILEILQDTATFSQISAQDSTIALKTFKSSLNRMKRSRLISTEEHKSFTTNLPNGTYIYGLPKVHKPSVPLRPIIAYHLSPAYPLAKYLSNYLSPLLNNNRSNLTVSSTPTLIQEITGLHPPQNFTMCSFDVSSLYLSLPHHLIIYSLNQFLVSINTDPVKTNSITSLSQICLNMSTFTFDHIHFKQIRGSPMGSPLSSIAAELVMTRIDKWVCNLHCDDILFWRRYVDDILCICKTDHEETILSTLNSYNPNLSFTMEKEQGHIIPFLDILIIRTPASFHTTVYYKNSSTPTYTHFNSFCPIVHKINIVKTLTRRLHTHCSLPIFKTTEKARIISHLTAASYPLTFINKHTYSPAPSNPPPVFRTTCMLPYSPLTVSISRLIRPFGIRTFFINTPSIHSLLRHPITKTSTQLSPLDSSGAVYSVSCEHCSATYVGETGRTVAIRMSEHTRNINNNDPRSLIYQHVASTGHSFNTNHPTIHYRNIPNLHQRLMRARLSLACEFPCEWWDGCSEFARKQRQGSPRGYSPAQDMAMFGQTWFSGILEKTHLAHIEWRNNRLWTTFYSDALISCDTEYRQPCCLGRPPSTKSRWLDSRILCRHGTS